MVPQLRREMVLERKPQRRKKGGHSRYPKETPAMMPER